MKIYVCRICGEVYLGDGIPPSCPYCGVNKKYLRLGHVWEDENVGIEPTERERELLLEALELELSNTSFYDCVAKTCTTIEIAKMFKGLKKQEKEHAEVFEKLAKPDKVKVSEINETCEDDPKKILADSLAREQRATEFYNKALGESTTPRVKDVFEAIRDVEMTHIQLDEAIREKFN